MTSPQLADAVTGGECRVDSRHQGSADFVALRLSGNPMCYSAQVVQDLKKLFRELNVFMDYEEAERIFLLRLDDPTVNISKGFEANFDNPANESSAASKRPSMSIDLEQRENSRKSCSRRRLAW